MFLFSGTVIRGRDDGLVDTRVCGYVDNRKKGRRGEGVRIVIVLVLESVLHRLPVLHAETQKRRGSGE
jgi:hypothetical protein